MGWIRGKRFAVADTRAAWTGRRWKFPDFIKKMAVAHPGRQMKQITQMVAVVHDPDNEGTTLCRSAWL